jgi:four helix bundle protein
MANGSGGAGGWRRQQQTTGDGRRETGASGRPYDDGRGREPQQQHAQPTGAGQKKGSRGYKDLIAWQKAMQLVPVVYRLVQRLPNEERFALADQLRRAAVSVPANIAEGQGRGYSAEFARALAVARGSLAELDTLLLTAVALGYLKPRDLEEVDELMLAVRMITQKLIQRLRDGPKDSDGRRTTGDGRRGDVR